MTLSYPQEYRVGDLIEWVCSMNVYATSPGRHGSAPSKIREIQVEIIARVHETKRTHCKFALVENIYGYIWSRRSKRRQELSKAFMADIGMSIRGLEPLMRLTEHTRITPVPKKIQPQTETIKENVKYIRPGWSLGKAPSYSVNACQREGCGGTVHTDYDEHGEVRRCMACGRSPDDITKGR